MYTHSITIMLIMIINNATKNFEPIKCTKIHVSVSSFKRRNWIYFVFHMITTINTLGSFWPALVFLHKAWYKTANAERRIIIPTRSALSRWIRFLASEEGKYINWAQHARGAKNGRCPLPVTSSERKGLVQEPSLAFPRFASRT